MESGSRAQVLFFIIHGYFYASGDIKFDNILNLIICIHVVCTKYNYIFLNLTNFDFEKKV